MKIYKECCPVCGDENYEIKDCEEERALFNPDYHYKRFECICQNGHRFSMSETYLLIERECVSMEEK